MHITNILTEAFNGRSHSIVLGPATLIRGGNFTGKTGLTNAIRLALLGVHPHAKQIGRLFELFGCGSKTRFELTFNDGRSLANVWEKSIAGKVTRKGGPSPDLMPPAVLLDLNEYFKTPAMERTRYIFSQCPLVGFDVDKVNALIGEVKAIPVAEGEKLVKEAQDKVNDLLAKKSPTTAWQDWLATVIEYVRNESKQALEKAKADSTMSQTIRAGMQAVKFDADAHAKLSAERDRLVLAKSEYERDANNRAGIKSSLANYERMLAALKEVEGEIPDVADLCAKRDAEEKLWHTANTDYATVSRKLENATQAVNAVRSEIAAIEERASSMRAMGLCEDCLAKLLKADAERLPGLNTRFDEATNAQENTEMECFDAQRNVEDRLQAVNEWNKQINAARNMANQRSERENILKNIASGKALLESAAPVFDAAKLAEVQAKFDESNRTKAEHENQKIKAVRLNETGDRILNHERRGNFFKACDEALVGFMNSVINDSVGSLLAVANKFTDGILNSPLELHEGELGRRTSEKDVAMGYPGQTGEWISHEAFSGTEQSLAYAAFSVALANKAKFKIVLIDEMGRISPENKVPVAQRMVQLVNDGVIDQWIGIDVANDYAGVAGLHEVVLQA